MAYQKLLSFFRGKPKSIHAAWADSTATVAAQASRLKPGPYLAIDTEADSLHHYKESVCLVSIRQDDTCFLIDPLAQPTPDLKPFWKIAGNTPWILHGADFDLRLMRRIGSPEPPEVFDTMIGAQLCGLPGIGYAALVEHFFGVKLSKASQKADWSARPLTPAMHDYAAQDVTYLDGIREKQTAILKKLGRLEWHKESCAKVVQTSRSVREIDTETLWRINGSSKLSPTALPILRELWLWRDAEAKERDVPTFKMMNGDRMLEVAAWVDTHRDAEHLPGYFLSSNHRGARALRLHDAVKRGKELPPLGPLPSEPRPRRDPKVDRRVEKIRKGRDELAAKLNLDPSLIASKTTLYALAQEGPAGLTSLVAENRWCRWQAELLRPFVQE